MSTSLRPWLPPRHRIPLALFALVYCVNLWLAVAYSGVRFSGAFSMLMWPGWVGHLLAFDSGGLLRPAPQRPDFPSGRLALAAVAFGLVPATAWIVFGSLSGVDRTLTNDWVLVVMFGSAALFGLAHIPDPANWARQWNVDQANRIVAAEHALASARARVLQSQMQPHFLFNALNSVTALLREDPARAKAVLLSLKGLMERSLVNAQDPMTTVGREVAFVRDQLAIEQERFHDRLHVRFEVPDDVLMERIPAFSLQPLAENALRHGIAQSIEGGRVVVRAFREVGQLVLRVDNTGADLDPRWREGTGFSNLRARLVSMYDHEATLSLSGTGNVTMAEIRLPLSGPRTFRAGPLVQAPGGFDR